MIVDKIQWNLTNEVRVRLAPRSWHSQSQISFPDKPHMCTDRWVTPTCLLDSLRTAFGDGRLVNLIFNIQVHNATSVSTERLFSSVELVKNDLRGILWTPPWFTWCGLNKHPKLILKASKRKDTLTLTRPDILSRHTPIYVTGTHQYIERCLYTYSTSYLAQACRLSTNCW